ncbi:MAG: hypothetical protein ACK5OB_18835 [Pirellula sp.]
MSENRERRHRPQSRAKAKLVLASGPIAVPIVDRRDEDAGLQIQPQIRIHNRMRSFLARKNLVTVAGMTTRKWAGAVRLPRMHLKCVTTVGATDAVENDEIAMRCEETHANPDPMNLERVNPGPANPVPANPVPANPVPANARTIVGPVEEVAKFATLGLQFRTNPKGVAEDRHRDRETKMVLKIAKRTVAVDLNENANAASPMRAADRVPANPSGPPPAALEQATVRASPLDLVLGSMMTWSIPTMGTTTIFRSSPIWMNRK